MRPPCPVAMITERLSSLRRVQAVGLVESFDACSRLRDSRNTGGGSPMTPGARSRGNKVVRRTRNRSGIGSRVSLLPGKVSVCRFSGSGVGFQRRTGRFRNRVPESSGRGPVAGPAPLLDGRRDRRRELLLGIYLRLHQPGHFVSALF